MKRNLLSELKLKFFELVDKHLLKEEKPGLKSEIQILQDVYSFVDGTNKKDIFDYEDPALLEEDEYDLPEKIYPYYKILGEGFKWYLDPLLNTMVKIKLGTTVTKLHDKPDKQGRVLVYTPNFYLAIPENELCELGFN